jgi:hypothetical protein
MFWGDEFIEGLSAALRIAGVGQIIVSILKGATLANSESRPIAIFPRPFLEQIFADQLETDGE